MHMAAELGDEQLCQLLVSYGAPLNAKDVGGRIPEDTAKEYGHEACRALLHEVLLEVRRAFLLFWPTRLQVRA